MKTYELALPVFKQGDDLHSQIEHAKGNLSEAFKAQAEAYEEAARLCKRMAEVSTQHSISVEANTHVIIIEGPESVLEALEKEEVLRVQDYGDEEDSDEEAEEEEFEDEDEDEDEEVNEEDESEPVGE